MVVRHVHASAHRVPTRKQTVVTAQAFDRRSLVRVAMERRIRRPTGGPRIVPTVGGRLQRVVPLQLGVVGSVLQMGCGALSVCDGGGALLARRRIDPRRAGVVRRRFSVPFPPQEHARPAARAPIVRRAVNAGAGHVGVAGCGYRRDREEGGEQTCAQQ